MIFYVTVCNRERIGMNTVPEKFCINNLFCKHYLFQFGQHFFGKREGSGAGSILVTNGSGCGSVRPKKRMEAGTLSWRIQYVTVSFFPKRTWLSLVARGAAGCPASGTSCCAATWRTRSSWGRSWRHAASTGTGPPCCSQERHKPPRSLPVKYFILKGQCHKMNNFFEGLNNY